MSELLDKAVQIRAKISEAESKKAAEDLLEENRKKTEQQRIRQETREREEQEKTDDLNGTKCIKEFVELMLRHKVPLKDLYSIKSSRPNRMYLRGFRSSPNYRMETFFEYGLHGKGWVTSFPGNELVEYSRDDYRKIHVTGLIVMSDMTLCEWDDHYDQTQENSPIMVFRKIVRPGHISIDSLSKAVVAAGIV